MSFTLNFNGARGFQPYKAQNGTPMRTVEYPIASAYATSIFRGAPVDLHTDGTLIVPANVDAKILGVFDGVEYIDAQGNVIFSPYWPASTAVKTGTVPKARVYEAQGALFLVTADEAIAQADVGEYFALTALSGGSTVTGQSSIQLDGDSNGTSVVDKTVVLRNIPDVLGATDQAVVQFIRPVFPDTAVFPATA